MENYKADVQVELPAICKVATAKVLGISLAVALVDKILLRPGVGDELLSRLLPHFNPRPVLLVAADDEKILSYASFQTERIAEALGDEDLDWYDLELRSPPLVVEGDLPF